MNGNNPVPAILDLERSVKTGQQPTGNAYPVGKINFDTTIAIQNIFRESHVIMDSRNINKKTDFTWFTNKSLATFTSRREDIISCAEYRIKNEG